MVGKVQHGKSILQIRNLFHKIGPRKSNFILTFYLDVSSNVSSKSNQESTEESGASKGPGSTNHF